MASIPAGGTNYNVKKSWSVPEGYKLNSVSVYATAGCIAGCIGFPDNGVLSASVYNPTTSARTPYVTWMINLKKE